MEMYSPTFIQSKLGALLALYRTLHDSWTVSGSIPQLFGPITPFAFQSDSQVGPVSTNRNTF